MKFKHMKTFETFTPSEKEIKSKTSKNENVVPWVELADQFHSLSGQSKEKQVQGLSDIILHLKGALDKVTGPGESKILRTEEDYGDSKLRGPKK